jgi:hypothetical protein
VQRRCQSPVERTQIIAQEALTNAYEFPSFRQTDFSLGDHVSSSGKFGQLVRNGELRNANDDRS